MAWTSVGSISVQRDWQFTDPIAGTYFRLKHEANPINSSYEVAQVELDANGNLQIFDVRELKPRIEPEIIEMKKPLAFSNRRIAVRRLPKQPTLELELRRVLRETVLSDSEINPFPPRRIDWQVSIEVSDYVEPSSSTTTSSSENTSGSTAATDPYFANVVLLTHFDGTSNSIVFTDAKGKTITTNGNAKVDTTQSKFGTASAYFDGSGDYLRVDDSIDFHFGSGDFTIECWLRLEVSESRDRTIVAKISPSQNAFMLNIDPGNKISFSIEGYAAIASTTALVSSAWYHVAVSRNSGTAKLFINGNLEAQGSFPNSPQYSNLVYLGAFDPSNASYAFWYRGWIDDLRVTKGVARYVSNFDVPTLAFSNS